jgi:hypothetical protein
MLVGLLAALAPAALGVDERFPVYTGDEFQALYVYAVEQELPNLVQLSGEPVITGEKALDDRIWALAFERGYVLRPEAGPGLVSVDGVLMQPQAAEAWKALRTAAREAGLTFIVSSGYRSVTAQRSWFNSKLSGTSDPAINSALEWYSVPGTSKHHGGYTLDFRYRDGTFGEFRETPDYAWLSAENFAAVKRFGFIPSYPDDVTGQGPKPEPWEFVWVGVERIRCGVPLDSGSIDGRYARRLLRELSACPGSVSIGEVDQMVRVWGPKLESMLIE